MSKKICVITGTRAEYGLLYPLLLRLKKDKDFKLQIIATNMHLSKEFGLTYKLILKDGFTIDRKVHMLVDDDSPQGISESIGRGITGISRALKKLNPDLVVLLGDRFETFAAATASFISRIPIAHFNGGELTEGVIDDAIRHSITKMSYLHFVSTREYGKRVVQLGESPRRVFVVGSLGLDNIREMPLYSKPEFETRIGFGLGEKNALVTFHPVTLEKDTAERDFKELLKALDGFPQLKIIFTKPNADTEGRSIIKLIDRYVAENPDRSVSFITMGQRGYLSAMKHVDVVIGNSSSGIIEAPSFHKPTVNIGDRQRGRIRADSVIDCEINRHDIAKAIRKSLSADFIRSCRKTRNPYGNGNCADRAAAILKAELKKPMDIKKKFFDINFRAMRI
ncbi:MAG: UDP-N-acetylglucosamine 2-epimerase [Candidatus Omnitrophica bacterium]|nr:UDP-N-acetylglucosamine 2-epimerase [Candidatus Omnitrophota bacterium]